MEWTPQLTGSARLDALSSLQAYSMQIPGSHFHAIHPQLQGSAACHKTSGCSHCQQQK